MLQSLNGKCGTQFVTAFLWKRAKTARRLRQNALPTWRGKMSANEMRERFVSEELTWADLLEITGLPAATLYEILEGLI